MSPLVEFVARVLLGPAVVVAIAIMVKGYGDVGDGFSAGVIVGLAFALLAIAIGARRAEAALPILRRAPQVVVAGLLVALAAGFFPLLQGEPPFRHAPAAGEHPVTIGKLELITAVVFDVGVFLLVAGLLVLLVHSLAEAAEEDAR